MTAARRPSAAAMALREALEGFELVVDPMAQQRAQHARAGKTESLEVRETGSLALGRGRHPNGEESSLHDAPARAENCAEAQADTDIGSDLDFKALALVLQDGEPGDVLLPLRRPVLEVARHAPDVVERRVEHALPKRRLRHRGDQDPHPTHGI